MGLQFPKWFENKFVTVKYLYITWITQQFHAITASCYTAIK